MLRKLTNRKAQINMWELVVLLALILAVFVWMDFKKDTNVFSGKSKQSNETNHYIGLINLANPLSWQGCATVPVKKANVLPPVVRTVTVIKYEEKQPDFGNGW